MNKKQRIVIIGGGASGIFAAALAAEKGKDKEIIVLEKTAQLLAKVRISGGGRCNVTHAEFNPKHLIHFYPRGHKELLGPFHHFQPKDTIAWFEKHGVQLKTEEDGRMFPITDCSETIINCLLKTAKENGVDIRCKMSVQSIEKTEQGFLIHFNQHEPLPCDALILATGSSPQGHAFAKQLGHTISPPVPSLFTFNVPSSSLLELSGISIKEAVVSLKGTRFEQKGPLLLTHFGFSGPAVLKLSAWAARYLFDCNYQTDFLINWIPQYSEKSAYEKLLLWKQESPLKGLETQNPFSLPLQLFKRFLSLSGLPQSTPLSHLSNTHLKKLAKKLTEDLYTMDGKTTYKQEFVTCGGISLREIDFRTMQSRLIPHLFFIGEILDIDGVTGGFNFQNAWTTAFLATQALFDAKRAPTF